MNFFDYFTWNDEPCSSTNYWHFQGRWKTNQLPQITFTDLGGVNNPPNELILSTTVVNLDWRQPQHVSTNALLQNMNYKTMKNYCYLLNTGLLGCLLASLSADVNQAAAPPKDLFGHARVDEVVASARAKDLATFERVAEPFAAERRELITKLVEVFNDVGCSNLSRCCAAYL